MNDEPEKPKLEGSDYFGVVMAEDDRRLLRNPRVSSALARAGRLAKKHNKKFFVLKVVRMITHETEHEGRHHDDQNRRESWDAACAVMQRERQHAIRSLKKAAKLLKRQLGEGDVTDEMSELSSAIQTAKGILDGSIKLDQAE